MTYTSYLGPALLGVVWVVTIANSRYIGPVGPKLCQNLCNHIYKCRSYYFTPSKLLCYLSSSSQHDPGKGTHWFKPEGEKRRFVEKRCHSSAEIFYSKHGHLHCIERWYMPKGMSSIFMLNYNHGYSIAGQDRAVAYNASLFKLVEFIEFTQNSTIEGIAMNRDTGLIFMMPKYSKTSSRKIGNSFSTKVAMLCAFYRKPNSKVSALYVKCDKKTASLTFKLEITITHVDVQEAQKSFCFDLGNSCSIILEGKSVDCLTWLMVLIPSPFPNESGLYTFVSCLME